MGTIELKTSWVDVGRVENHVKARAGVFVPGLKRGHSMLRCAHNKDGVQARNLMDSAPGTYWWRGGQEGSEVTVEFRTSNGLVATKAREGSNLLRAAQECNAVKVNPDFCYDGTCELCVMEVEGAREVGKRADPDAGEFVRACLTPVPGDDQVLVKILDEDLPFEDGWV